MMLADRQKLELLPSILGHIRKDWFYNKYLYRHVVSYYVSNRYDDIIFHRLVSLWTLFKIL